jgi:endonuclease/exonuclease/phosphatase family metal-dependent hydrolase
VSLFFSETEGSTASARGKRGHRGNRVNPASSENRESKTASSDTIKDMRVLYTNADQLKNKLTELEIRVEELQPWIIAITEVKPKHSRYNTSEGEYMLEKQPNYNVYSKNVDGEAGRGLLLYVNKNLKCSEAKIDSHFEEFLAVEIQLNGNDTLLVVLVYRSDAGTAENNNQLNTLLTQLARTKNTHLLILGDFNYPTINWQDMSTTGSPSSKEAHFIEAFMASYLTQHVTMPTRARGQDRANLLDLVITNEEHMVRDITHESPLGKSDHSVIIFNLVCYVETKEKWIERYMYHKMDSNNFNEDLRTTNWDEVFVDDDPNTSWKKMEQRLKELTEKHVPVMKFNQFKQKSHNFPLSKETREKIKEKNRLARKVFREGVGDKEDRKKYNKARNRVQKLVNQSRKQFEQNIASNAKTNPKTIWRYVKSKQKTKAAIEELHVSPTDTTTRRAKEDQAKANILADYFTSVFCIEDPEGIPQVELVIAEVPDVPVVTTAEEVEKLLRSLKTDKSPGPDNIHPALLKALSQSLSEPLARLFNMSFRKCKIPVDWKNARVCAIHRKGNTHLASNYRPVSLTSIVSKICEKIIRRAILDHLDLNDLLTDKQYGFTTGRNISLQLLNVLEDWTEAYDRGEEVDCIYLDFAKAFDKVPHRRLITKIRSLAVHQTKVDWIEDFLTSRKQRVTVGEASSPPAEVTSGIPQGSVLGPILFLLFINDLPESVTSKLFLFADDTKIYAINDVQELQADLNQLVEWSKKWRLTFNADKCKHLHIGRNNPEDLYLDGQHLNHVKEEKDLGVMFEDSLTFHKHISAKVNQANKMFGILRRTFRHMDKETFLPLYKGMVRSHLDFSAAVYSPFHKADIDKIEAVQRRATKQLPQMKGKTYPERLKILRLPTLAYTDVREQTWSSYSRPQADSTERNFASSSGFEQTPPKGKGTATTTRRYSPLTAERTSESMHLETDLQ